MSRLVATKEKRAKMLTTVLVPTSPIPSHPDTRIIDETISTIRTHLDSEIIIMIDGIRDEQLYLKEQYQEYIRRLLWKCNNEWENVIPLLFEEHQHQANMTRKALQLIKTPLILFVEHDTPLTPDRDINWDSVEDMVLSEEANMVRLHHEALVLDVHKYLMIGEPEYTFKESYWRTYQWSQRPHIASTEFYRRILEQYFPPSAKTMIEDRMYGVLEEAYRHRGKMGWDEFKVWMYYPEGDIKRSYHIDGREGEQKYEETFGI